MRYGPAVLTMAVALCAVLIVLGSRWRDTRTWRRSLMAYRLRLPADLTADSVTHALSIITAISQRWPMALEIHATHRGIGHYVMVPDHLASTMLTRVTTAMPGVRLEEAPQYPQTAPQGRLAREWRGVRRWRPLAAENAPQSVSGLLASLYPLGRDEFIRIQWLVSATRHVSAHGDPPPEVARVLADKNTGPLVDAVGRVSIGAQSHSRAALLLSGVLSAVSALSVSHNRLRRRALPSWWVARAVASRALPVTDAWWPVLLNPGELAALVAFPIDGVRVPGLTVGSARQLPAPVQMRRRGLVVGLSNYPGMTDRPLALATDDRLRHLLIQGPTGSGKSELIANMAIQDMSAGSGVVVIDPKSDLVEKIAARIPEYRLKDVIVLDPASLSRPVGFNILQNSGDEHARELVVDRTLHIFGDLWRSSWGPRTADVLRNCLLALTAAKAHDGSPFTLIEIPSLLTDETFRRLVLRQRIPASVRDFWRAYEQMSAAEKQQVIGPVMNKLRAFSTRSALRLMLGQSHGIDIGEVFRRRRILLVPLSKGRIGPEAAHLLGSLLVAMLWQETLGRSAIPAERRRPVFAYLDEFQEFVHFGGGGELAEMLAQARGLGLGLTLAYQYLDQLSGDVTPAVLGTVRSQLVYQLEYRDAEAMAKRFEPLQRHDLSGLDAFEIAMRPCIQSRTFPPVTGRTLPLGEPLRDPETVLDLSRESHGIPREDVESACEKRLKPRMTVVPPIGSAEHKRSPFNQE